MSAITWAQTTMQNRTEHDEQNFSRNKYQKYHQREKTKHDKLAVFENNIIVQAKKSKGQGVFVCFSGD